MQYFPSSNAANTLVTNVGSKYVRTTRFVSIGGGTSGTVTLPSNSSVVLDDFGGTVDAVVTQISSGKPTQIPALTAGGAVVAATFDSSGNWTFSGTPSAYPVALVYRVQQTLSNFDSTSSDIWAESEFHSVLPIADGGTGNTTGLAATSTAPASGSAHGAVTLDGSGNFQSVAPGAAGGFMRSNGTDFVRAGISGSDVPTLAPMSDTATNMFATTGTDGQLFWNTTYKAMFVWVNSRWIPMGAPDKRYGIYIEDDFLSPTTGSQFGWTPFGTNNFSAIAQTGEVGAVTIRQSTAANRSMMTSNAAGLALGASDAYYEAIIYIPTLSTVSEDFVASLGFYDNTSYDANGAAVDGCYFSYNRANNGAKWNCVTASNSSLTTTQTNTAIAANTFYRLGILVNGTTSAKFYVNGTLVATNSTNIPSGNSRATGIAMKVDKTAGSANSDLVVDSVSWWVFFNSPRVS